MCICINIPLGSGVEFSALSLSLIPNPNSTALSSCQSQLHVNAHVSCLCDPQGLGPAARELIKCDFLERPIIRSKSRSRIRKQSLEMFLLLALSYLEKNVEYTLRHHYTVPRSFGFRNDGHYRITMHHASGGEPVLFGLLTKDEYKKYDKDDPEWPSDQQTGTCPDLLGITEVYNQTEITLQGNIPSKGVYYLYFFMCKPSDSDVKIEVTWQFGNGKSWLDTRYMPALIEEPIAMVIFCLILIYWIVNWILNRNTGIYIHYCLTFVFILAFVFRVVRYAVLRDEEKSDYRIGMHVFELVFHLLFLLVLYVTILLVAKGWCIIRRGIRIV